MSDWSARSSAHIEPGGSSYADRQQRLLPMPALSDNIGDMLIRACSADHVGDWATLRRELWPDGDLDEHRRFAIVALSDPTRFAAFFAQDRAGQALGFAEASLRHDYVNGCATSPVAFLEGLYVRTEARRQGLGSVDIQDSREAMDVIQAAGW